MQKIYCIDEDGIHGLWDDDLCVGLGEAEINRASDVEPTEDGKWVVRLRQRCGDPGSYLSWYFSRTSYEKDARRFDRRDEAIAYEIEYFNRKILSEGAAS